MLLTLLKLLTYLLLIFENANIFEKPQILFSTSHIVHTGIFDQMPSNVFSQASTEFDFANFYKSSPQMSILLI